MVKIYLITGFLGSGKTTFLNEQLKDCSRKTGVLMNEFGKVSMDSITVNKNDIDLLELTNGSIFCACLKERFIDGLAELVKMDLDEIYIESSGLSDPSNMESVLSIVQKQVPQSTFSYEGSICLVDGLYFFEELEKMVNVERQIKHSHYIIINKADLIDEEKIQKIKATLISLNAQSKIVVAEHGKCHIHRQDGHYFQIQNEETTNRDDNRPKQILLTFIQEPAYQQLQAFLQEICPAFYRFKGYVHMENKCIKIDGVQGRIDMEEVLWASEDKTGYNELVFLGSKGIESVSILATAAEQHIAGLYKLSI